MQQTPDWIQLVFKVPQQQWAVALAFWPAATGWHPVSAGAHRRDLTPDSGDGWVVLQATRATEPEVHLELVSTDGESAFSHALQQGASPPDTTSPMRSPGGMAFRYADATSRRRFNRAGLEQVLDQVCLDIPAPLWAVEVAFWEAMIGREGQTRGRPEFARLIDPDPQGSPRKGPREGLVLHCAQDERGWVALVVYVVPRSQGDLAVQEWVPAGRLRAAKNGDGSAERP